MVERIELEKQIKKSNGINTKKNQLFSGIYLIGFSAGLFFTLIIINFINKNYALAIIFTIIFLLFIPTKDKINRIM